MGKKQEFRYWLEWPDGRVYQDHAGATFLYTKDDPDGVETRLISRARAREAKGLGPFHLRRAKIELAESSSIRYSPFVREVEFGCR